MGFNNGSWGLGAKGGGGIPDLSGYAKLGSANFFTAFNNFSNGLSTTTAQAAILNLITSTTVYDGIIGGNATFVMSFQGARYKKVLVYCNALSGAIKNGLGVPTSYVFPVAFTYPPAIINTNSVSADVVTTLTNTEMIVTGDADIPTTGFLILEGF